jgi:CheY-like chemotaxis protein
LHTSSWLFGFEVLTASDGLQGVEIFREGSENIVAVLLVMTMPKLDGEAAFMKLRSIRADTPVILMSGYNERDIAERFEGKGLAGFIQKSFLPDTLIKMLQTFGG